MKLLDPDFGPRSWTTQLRTRVAGALDAVMLRGMGLVFENSLLPPEEELPRIRESARPYLTSGLCRRPRDFFAFVDRPMPALDVEDVGPPRAIAGGTIVTRRFPSDYIPHHPIDLEGLHPCPQNETGWIEHWVHESGRPRATMLTLHGLTMGRPALDAQALMAERWFGLGLDVALMTLPFHGARASAHCGYSGERFTSWHVGRLNEAVRQSVYDAVRVSRWLEETSDAPVGILGVSLGGYLAAVMAGLCPDLAFVIPVVPAACLADLPLRLFARSQHGRSGMEPPIAPATLRRAYAVHSPLRYPLRVPRERVLIIGGRGDAVTPVAHAGALWRHWGRPKAVWFSGGHVTCFDRSQVVGGIETHLNELGLVGVRPRPRLCVVVGSARGRLRAVV